MSIISARVEFDLDMVRAFIEHHGLDPVPSKEPASASDATGARLTVETYSWGRVFYAEHRGRGLGLSWVERGEGGPELPAWVSVLRGRIDPPECFGWWRPVTECDGGRGAASPPCAWRGRCIPLQRRTLRRSRTSEVDLDPVTYTPRLAAVRAAVTLAELDGDTRPLPPLPQRRGSGVVRDPLSDRDPIYLLALHFVEVFSEVGGWPRVPTRWRCSLGRCFIVESVNVIGKRFFSLYLRRPGPWHRLLKKRGKTRVAIPRNVGVARLYVNQSRINIRIWTDHVDPVAAKLTAEGQPGLQVRSVAKDRSRKSVSVSVSTREEIEAVARTVVYIVQSDLLCSKGCVPSEVARNGPTPWQVNLKRRGRR